MHGRRGERQLEQALLRHRHGGCWTCGIGAGDEVGWKSHIVYGAGCGVPCGTDDTMKENNKNIRAFEGMSEDEKTAIGKNLYHLFPDAVKRMQSNE
jgi:hypothetical protein